MGHIPHAFENEIFENYRVEAQKIHKAITLLARQGYTLIDLEGQVITKFNIDDNTKPFPNIRYNKIRKQ
jgi:hypothetical protein|tara:strand:+ start:1462 stop:1668 length:207 start_codon:yes stop_codon:yes gene_type:complete